MTLSTFSKVCRKCILVDQCFPILQISDIFLMCVTCSKEYKAVANGGCKNVSFMMNHPLEIVLCLLSFFATLTWFLSKTLSILRTLIKTNTERKYFYIYKYLILVKLENIGQKKKNAFLKNFAKYLKRQHLNGNRKFKLSAKFSF